MKTEHEAALERIATHPECPKAIYNIAADALNWARKHETCRSISPRVYGQNRMCILGADHTCTHTDGAWSWNEEEAEKRASDTPGPGDQAVSIYTVDRCLLRADATSIEDSEYPRLIREHEEVAKAAFNNPEVRRIALGFAHIARQRLEHDKWRSEAYARLARGEDITRETGP